MGSQQYGVRPGGFVRKPDAEILSEIQADQLSLVDPTLDTSPTEPIGGVNTTMVRKIGELWDVAQDVYNARDRDKATGGALDNIGGLTGSLRGTVRPSYVYCTVAFSLAQTYPAGTLVAYLPSNNAVKFHNAMDIEVSTPGVQPSQALFISQEDGPDPANLLNAAGVNSLTGMVPVGGWTSVTNPGNATPGSLEEEDPDYRLRQVEELAASGACTLDALKADLLELTGMIATNAVENTGTQYDPVTGLPPKSFMAIVFDGTIPAVSNDAIAQVIWNDKPAGIQPFGSSSGTATDADGNPQTMYFSRVSQVPIYFDIQVTLAPGAVIGTVAPAVKAAIVQASQGQAFEAFGNTVNPVQPLQPPGANVDASNYASVTKGVQGVASVPLGTFFLGTAASPTSNADIPIGVTQIAVMDTSRIKVNGI